MLRALLIASGVVDSHANVPSAGILALVHGPPGSGAARPDGTPLTSELREEAGTRCGVETACGNRRDTAWRVGGRWRGKPRDIHGDGHQQECTRISKKTMIPRGLRASVRTHESFGGRLEVVALFWELLLWEWDSVANMLA